MGFLSSLFGGPSPQEEAAQASMAQAGKDMIYDSGVSFGDAQAMFKSITGQLAPILANGPSQFGMSTAQEAAERTILTTQLSQAGQEESQSVNDALASRNITPGAGISPGALAEIEGALANKTATSLAMGQLGITQQGYDIGRSNFWNAASESGQVGSAEGNLATSLGSTGVTATSDSFNEAQTINSQKNGFMKALMAVGGDIAGSFVGDPNLGGQLDSAVYGGSNTPAGNGSAAPGSLFSFPGLGNNPSQGAADANANSSLSSFSSGGGSDGSFDLGDGSDD
jgi:hypothetical protein